MRTKIISGKNYGSIPHLSNSRLGDHDRFIHEGQERIIRNGGRDKHDVVIVSLKLDGTNVGVLKKDGKLVTLQRKGYDCASSPYRQHHEFDKWVYRNYERFDSLLHEGDRIVGEWLWQASGIRYEITGDPFFAFDYFPYSEGGKARMSWDAMEELLQGSGIRTAPLLFHSGRTESNKDPIELAMKAAADFTLFGQHQLIGAAEHEGVVARVERKGVFDFMAKWVRSDFEAGRFLPCLGMPKGAAIVQNILIENEYYHTKEAATAHLEGVGLAFEGFEAWCVKGNKKIALTADYELAYPAKLVREYIRLNNQL